MAYQTLGDFRLKSGATRCSRPVLETSLRDDFNHHDPTTPDMRVYGRSLPGALWAVRGD